MQTGISTIQPLFNKPYFGFFENKNGKTFWTRLRIHKKDRITQEEIRHKKAIRSILARPHTKVPLVFNGIDFTVLIPKKDTKGVPRASRGRFFER